MMKRNLCVILSLLMFAFFSCSSDDIMMDPDDVNASSQASASSVPFGVDTKLTIAGGYASNQETINDSNPFEKSFDGNFSSIWHTKWSDVDAFPFTLTYNLSGADRLDYIMYYPRDYGYNGYFGKIEIQVTTATNPTFTKVMDYDCAQKGTASKISLPTPVEKPTAVRIIIKSGYGGFASCAEMEFYKIGSGIILPDANAKTVAIGGNSYVTAGSGGSVSDGGLVNWTGQSLVLSSYFRVNQSGNLRVFLKYSVASDNSVIKATIGGKEFNVTLPKKSTGEGIVFLGELTNCPEGYVKVDLQGVSRTGSVYANPSALVIDGTATTNTNYVGDFSYYWGRRGPSVHMGYTLPAGKNVEWFYNEVTVPVAYAPNQTFYMANGFGQGYFGMQTKAAGNWVLFSVWSPFETDDPTSIPESHKVKLVKKGEGVYGGEFGNEGAGGQSYLVYDWKPGTTYKFLNRVRPAANGYSEYTAYFYIPETGKWKLIAQFLRPQTNTYYTGAHSFLENFDPMQGHLTRKGYFNNQWVYTNTGEWIEVTQGRFTVDATGSPGWRKDYKGGADSSGFFLQNCGFFNDFVTPSTMHTRQAKGVAPNIPWSTLE